MFSHFVRCIVSLSIAYFESEIILRGEKVGAFVRATIIATISPTWFDWISPGTLMVQFWGSLGPNHTPLLLLAFFFLLFMHAPSVYTSIVGCLSPVPGVTRRCAGWFDSLVGSVKMRKQLVRSFFVVIVGSKVTELFWLFFRKFFRFRELVKDRLLW